MTNASIPQTGSQKEREVAQREAEQQEARKKQQVTAHGHPIPGPLPRAAHPGDLPRLRTDRRP
ncbi:MAG: hypothetical protein ACTIMA_14590 [Brachybacterium tyrofermentans]|uniref:hypothetical protein n=1 Tax=Brachybacterium tyrofermentans TaxID=47848 RepID=UPI00186906F1|nr:hypothetical protein [Brachybacterium tyrofermentans]